VVSESENIKSMKRGVIPLKNVKAVTNGKQKISKVILNDLKNWRTTFTAKKLK